MTNETIENSAPAPEKEQPKAKRKTSKKAKATKKPAPKRNRPSASRSNKKAEVIALMRRAKGATIGEIMKATDWQAHTVRGFVSILGKKGGEKIESSKSGDGERAYKIK